MEMTAGTENLRGRPAETPMNSVENQPRSPFRRRLLKAAVGVLAAEVLAGGALWGKDQFDKFFARPTTPTGEIPKPPAVEPDKPASEKAINKVPISELTKRTGLVSVVPFGGQMTAENPYGFSLSIANLTIVHVEKNSVDQGAWVAVSMPGEKLEKIDTGRAIANFDGSQTRELDFKGVTIWVFVDDNIFVTTPGSQGFTRGLGNLEESLIIGKTISFNIGMNQLDKKFQEMNLNSYQLLSASAGKPNIDRSDQAFRFRTTFANKSN